ncbi:hypothetical protein OSK34_02080 [Escherichia coli]|nr:hypothetical protein [Escherichia coli]MDA6097382.1 hypothetical protein [Escherichia coli]MDA6308293.1 hypothetical protein [Escherichia coli]
MAIQLRFIVSKRRAFNKQPGAAKYQIIRARGDKPWDRGKRNPTIDLDGDARI